MLAETSGNRPRRHAIELASRRWRAWWRHVATIDLFTGSNSSPPVYPTRVFSTPGVVSKDPCGCQNQPIARVATRGGWLSVIFGVYSGHGVLRESVRAAAPQVASAKTTARIAASHLLSARMLDGRPRCSDSPMPSARVDGVLGW